MKDNRKADIIAAAVTMLVTLIILLFLFTGSLNFDRAMLASSSIPEIQEEEELFIEPELTDLGEPDAIEHDTPAPAFKGEPEPAETDNTKLVVPGENPKPAPPVEKLVTTKKESPVKATEPTVSKEEKSKVTSSVANSFSGRNGATEGSNGSSGAGGTGSGVSGNANGRTFLGCSLPDVALRNKTVVKVNVVINAEGRVTSATASGSGDPSIRRKCEAAARTAKWSSKKGVAETRGSITFTIYPK